MNNAKFGLLVALALAASFSLALTGCGEKPQVVVYKQGEYQGKPDTAPWDNERFKGDKAAWENAVKERALAQNEYVRITGGGMYGK